MYYYSHKHPPRNILFPKEEMRNLKGIFSDLRFRMPTLTLAQLEYSLWRLKILHEFRVLNNIFLSSEARKRRGWCGHRNDEEEDACPLSGNPRGESTTRGKRVARPYGMLWQIRVGVS
jgi:hypothetical protein